MPNWLERATNSIIRLVSPRRAALRTHFARMEQDPDYRDTFFALMGARGYRAGDVSANSTPWGSGTTSADAEIINDLPRLRNRMRELDRDDPIGSGLRDTFVNNVIGYGIKPQARTTDTDKNKRIEAIYNEYSSQLTPADGLCGADRQRLIYGKVLEDGDFFVKESKETASDPIFFELIEGDRVDYPKDKKGKTENEIRSGVEKDKYGRPIAFYISKNHPGDTMAGLIGKSEYTRVDAEYVKHLKMVDRPGQTRGVPMLHAVLQDLRDIDLLLLASLKRVQIAACLSVFLTSENKMDDVFSATAKQYGYKLDQQIEPGMIFKLYPNEKVETLVPNFPTPELMPFIIMLARRIGAAVGVSWQVVLKDFGDSTYSSARTDLLETRQVYLIHQHWFINNYLRWEWDRIMADAALRGDARLKGVTPEDLASVQWVANGWKWVDPQKEAKAVEIELTIGTTTLQEVCASQGKDWEAVLEQRVIEKKKEQDLMKEYGVEIIKEDVNDKKETAPKAESDDAE